MGPHRPSREGPRPSRERPQFFQLDKFSAQDVRAWEQQKDRLLKFHWEFYCSLSYQRRQASGELRQALLEAAQAPFVFSRWQRAVRFRHVVEPLSVAGSLRSDPGGRFNIGALAPEVFPPFPALYAACEKDTALQEYLCQSLSKQSPLTPQEHALLDPTSLATISLSGRLDRIIDLREPHRLDRFVKIIAAFKLPKPLIREAKQLGLKRPNLVRTRQELLQVLLSRDWRVGPMAYDVPAQPQIFGSLVVDAGIEGVIYPSKFTSKECLAVYPQNFRGGDSYIELDDQPPPQTKIRRLDAATWPGSTDGVKGTGGAVV